MKFEVRFKTEIRNPGVFTAAVGGIAGIPPITALDGPGSEGLGLRQTYSVTMIRDGRRFDLTRTATRSSRCRPTRARAPCPTTRQPGGLFEQGIYTLARGIRVFAGTTDDNFYIDLGAAFDSLNFRMAAGGGVLSPDQDADDATNFAPDDVSGFNVNTIAIEVPIELLTKDGRRHASDRAAGGARHLRLDLAPPDHRAPAGGRRPPVYDGFGLWRQVQRMGNPLINELIIGTGSKDRFSMDKPENDAQFADFFLNPLLATVFGTLGIPVPSAPRTDLLPLVTYTGPIAPRRHARRARWPTCCASTPASRPRRSRSQQRLGLLTLLDGDPTNDDPAGFPNGRRPNDDVTDIAARAVGGILADPVAFGTRIGDGVNLNDMPKRGDVPVREPVP